MVSRKAFVKEYVDAIERRTAAVFMGAGMSVAAKYPDWRTLLKEIAEELRLDIEREQDLAGIAQFHLNRSKQRTKLAQLIRDAFPPAKTVPDSHRILARLPIHFIWTTNYDGLIEQAWKEQNKRLDVKAIDKDLTTDDRDAHGVLYKMHGTAERPAEVVIAKDDYELYVRTRPGFLQRLGSDLSHKTFLFLGLSFTDPNLAHLLASIRATYHEVSRTHYALLRSPQVKGKGKAAKKLYDYESNRFGLWIEDLRRYGIEPVTINEYDEIPEILREIESQYARRSIFVGGSYPEDGADSEERAFISGVSRAVGRLLGRRGDNLVSGFGLTVGHSSVMGFLEEIYAKAHPSVERRLVVRPFPQVTPEGITAEEFRRRYREDMISRAGVCIFIGGTKPGEAVASGVMEEYKIAKAGERVVVPIGCTGGAARSIWEDVEKDFKRILPKKVKKDAFRRLGGKGCDVETVIKALEEILDQLSS